MNRCIKAACLAVMIAGTAPLALAEIPDIDSSGWATDPRDHGMAAKEYIQAESRAFMADFIGRVGLNTFYHFPGLATAEERWVVSPNNDTLYLLILRCSPVTTGFPNVHQQRSCPRRLLV